MEKLKIGDIYTIPLIGKYFLCFYKSWNGWLAVQLDTRLHTEEELLNKVCSCVFKKDIVVTSFSGPPIPVSGAMTYVKSISLDGIDTIDILDDYYESVLKKFPSQFSQKEAKKLKTIMKIYPSSDKRIISILNYLEKQYDLS